MQGCRELGETPSDSQVLNFDVIIQNDLDYIIVKHVLSMVQKIDLNFIMM